MGINTRLEHYPETGHCLVAGRIDSALLAGIREDLLEAIAARKRLPDWEQVKYRHHRDFALHVHLASVRVASLLRADPIPELVRGILGDEADLQFTSTMTKTAEKPAHVDWHQDSAYDAGPEPGLGKFQIWMAISESRRENGCLRILPGSHARGPVPHSPSRTLAADKEIADVDESGALDVEMGPGDLLVLHPHLHHASWPNGSGVLRMAMIAGFMLPKTQYPEFERKGTYRYLRGGKPVWDPVACGGPAPIAGL